jgi:hypothetical protein
VQRRWIVCASVVALLLGFPAIGTPEIIFTRIADTTTPVPGGTGNFTGFLEPSLDNGTVAFQGFGLSEARGIYAADASGTLRLVADRNTPIPGGTGSFESFFPPSVDKNGSLAIHAFGPSSQQGIYLAAPGEALRVIADRNTDIPGGTGNFTSFFGSPSISSGKVAFTSGFGPSGEQRIYPAEPGLRVVADTSTAIPGGTGNFDTFSSEGPSLDNDSVAFHGQGPILVPMGIYLSDPDGTLRVVADSNTPVPGGTGSFNFFQFPPSLDDGSVAFFAASGPGFRLQGVYLADPDGALRVVADTNSPIPACNGSFAFVGPPSLDTGRVAFRGFGSGGSQVGMYLDIGGTLIRVIGENDTLDGKVLREFGFGPEGLSGEQIAFLALFDDSSLAIYVAELRPSSIPESSSGTLLVTGLAGLLAVGWHCQRRRGGSPIADTVAASAIRAGRPEA